MTAARDQASFLLNGERHDVPRSVPPTRTLLDYLREDLRLTGTKEGCNEGDCGACTVVVTGPDGVARAVNACIQFVPMVDGMSVTTVEGLRGPNGELHPVQQAMVECHGSQCGFCTPGFVMSLYAAYLERSDPSMEGGGKPYLGRYLEFDELFAGNLCRCTGYGPIVAAAKRALAVSALEATKGDPPSPLWGGAGGGVLSTGSGAGLANPTRRPIALRLRAGAPTSPQGGGGPSASLALDHPSGKFFAPTTIDELANFYETHPEATILGGATDVGLWVTKQHRNVPVLISTAHIQALKLVDHAMGSERLVIGASVTYSEAFIWLRLYWPDLGELVRRLGSVQVRNSGTIGGNIANGSPIGDMPPALIALDATIELRLGQVQRSVPLEDFFVAYGKQDRQPGEFVLSVSVPVVRTAQRTLRCYKISKRFDQDISAVLGCFNLHIEAGQVTAARIAFGGMAGIPKRAKAVEAALLGKPWTMATVEAALPAFEQDFQPLTDMRASAQYRMLTAKNLLVRYFHETTSDVPTRLVGRGAMEAMGSDPIGLP